LGTTLNIFRNIVPCTRKWWKVW